MNRLLSRTASVFCILLAATMTAKATDYYVANDGNNANAGTSTGSPWQTIGKVNAQSFSPGDRIFFKRGHTFSGTTLDAKWNGASGSKITFGAYGSGAKPVFCDPNTSSVVKITGSYQVFENLDVKLVSQVPAPNGQNKRVLYKLGFYFNGSGAHHNDVKSCTIQWLAAGAAFDATSHDNAVFSNVFDYICLYWTEGDHLNGSICVNLKGDNNNVSWNTFNSSGSGPDATENAVEIYNARDCRIHHNKAFGVRVFSEMGSLPVTGVSDGNAYEYNLHSTGAASARFLVTRGEGHANGPVLNTAVYNNTVVFTGASSTGVTLQNGSQQQEDDGMLEMKNNIFFVRRAAPGSTQERCFWATGTPGGNPYFTEDYNLFYSDTGTTGGVCRVWDSTANGGNGAEINAVIGNNSAKTDPAFVNLGSGNFHLQSSSPARNAGTAVGNYGVDLDQVAAQEGTKDRGAYEYVP